VATLGRTIADALERVTGKHIVAPHAVSALYEVASIRRLIEAFSVDCVFDVGANAGQYAGMLRDRVGYRGAILSYEPVPALAKSLAQMAAGKANWIVRPVALDSSAERRLLHVACDSQFSSLRESNAFAREQFPAHLTQAQSIEIETVTLAHELPFWRERLDFARPYLKLDTQGHDLAVAKGAGDLLADFAIVQTEAAIKPLYVGAPVLADCLDFYIKRGFDLCAFVPNNEGAFPAAIEVDCLFVNRRFTGATSQTGLRPRIPEMTS